ncbi:MAG: hypothetical protein FJZ16_00740 [Candidatus Omnitrophica bacterium]|nr:hypothetical protein [Candidatus Omnitrophota bacterium]
MVPETDITKYIEELVQSLVVMRNTRLIYGKDHGITKRTLSTLYTSLEKVLQLRPDVTVAFIKNEVVFDKLPLYNLSAALEKFITDLSESGIEKIHFKAGLTKEELAGFIEVMVLKKGEVFEKGGYANALSSLGVKNIGISKVAVSEQKEEDVTILAKTTYNNALKTMQEFLDTLKKERNISVEGPRQVVIDILKVILRNKDALLISLNLGMRDRDILVHCLRVLILTLIQAVSLRVDKDLFSDFGEASLFHEIGELTREAGILECGAKTPMENAGSQKYADALIKLLVKTKHISKLTALVIYEIMKYNPLNYTAAIKTKKINLASILITLACYYDNLVSKASDLKMDYESIYTEIMRLKGEVFEKPLLERFFKLVGIYPPGSLLELTTGEIALTVRVNPDIRRPIAEILTDGSKNRLEQPKMADLSEIDSLTKSFKYNISRTTNPKELSVDIIPQKYK